MDELITLLRSISIGGSTHIPIGLVQELDRLRKEINHLEEPKFMDEQGNVLNGHWDEFKYTGLNNTDYVLSEFYLSGFQAE